jgi:hypothetical protein
MIEDMYKEELGEAELDSNTSSDNASRSKVKVPPSDEKEDLKNSTSQLGESKPNISQTLMTAS